MNLPAHIEARTYERTIYTCTNCGARVIPGVYENEAYVDQVLREWLNRHAHPTANQPNRRDQP